MVGIVLGAGSSRRLGRPKQTLPLGDTTLLGWVLRDVEVSALDRIVLVVGGAADEALAGLNLRRATVAYNESYGTGYASWLLAGLDAAGSCDAVMLLLGDMPGVAAPVIDAVRTDWERQVLPGVDVARQRAGDRHLADAIGSRLDQLPHRLVAVQLSQRVERRR
jgi:molybdenum cofactor cytidylyltransferase